MKAFKKLGVIKFGSSFLVNNYQNYNFNKFHTSTILFLKKKLNYEKHNLHSDIIKFLSSKNQINEINIKKYKEKKIKKIISLISTNNLSREEIFEKVIKIEKIKHKINKKLFVKKKLSNKFVNSNFDKVLNIIKK